MLLAFDCPVCGERHDDVPTAYRFAFPGDGFAPGAVTFERDGEFCAAGDDRFVLGNIMLPLAENPDEPFVWTVWFALNRDAYDRFEASYDEPERARVPPAFGWLWTPIPTYEPTTHRLRAYLVPKRAGVRFQVEIEPTPHPLAVEQQLGIGRLRIAEVYHLTEPAERPL